MDTRAEELGAEIARLSDLDIDGVRARWRKLFRASAPPHLPRYLLFRIIAYRIQANALGDLDPASVRYLNQVAENRTKRPAGKKRNKAAPPIPPVLPKRSLKPGTILVREHEGKLHRVTVLTDGFAWNETTYRSLSEAAFAITGTKWNGPRFFGLRDRQSQLVAAAENEARA